MQAAGADIMRLTMMGFRKYGLELLAPVHDGFLLTCRRNELNEARAQIDKACTSAVAHVLPGFQLRWEVEIHETRYRDKDGAGIWDMLLGWLGDSPCETGE